VQGRQVRHGAASSALCKTHELPVARFVPELLALVEGGCGPQSAKRACMLVCGAAGSPAPDSTCQSPDPHLNAYP